MRRAASIALVAFGLRPSCERRRRRDAISRCREDGAARAENENVRLQAWREPGPELLTWRVLLQSDEGRDLLPTFRTGRIRNVPESEKHQVEIEYGLTPRYPEKATLPAGAPGFHVKDKPQNKLHDLVCDGTMSLRSVQRQIAANWQALYRKVFGLAPAGEGLQLRKLHVEPGVDRSRVLRAPAVATPRCASTSAPPSPFRSATQPVQASTPDRRRTSPPHGRPEHEPSGRGQACGASSPQRQARRGSARPGLRFRPPFAPSLKRRPRKVGGPARDSVRLELVALRA